MFSTSGKKKLKEAHGHYPDVFDELFDVLERTVNEKRLVGETTDKTLVNVYTREGWLQCVDEMKNIIRTL